MVLPGPWFPMMMNQEEGRSTGEQKSRLLKLSENNEILKTLLNPLESVDEFRVHYFHIGDLDMKGGPYPYH